MAGRNTSADGGLGGRIAFYILTHFPGFWKWARSARPLGSRINAFLINQAIAPTKPRPNALSLLADYTSWRSLTDRTYSSRHLPPAPDGYKASLPPVDEVLKLFHRDQEKLSPKSTVLFAHFAQWFTDGFLRTSQQNWKKNTSNHDIDLSELYGLNSCITCLLREKVGGRLKSQIINGEEYPPFYFDKNGEAFPEFKRLPIVVQPPDLPNDKKALLFAMGGERANVQIGFVALNVLFLREHNRICGVLQEANPTWDDERLFQTARCILTVILIKIVIEEYIPHISPLLFKFIADPTPFSKVDWYRTNWMAVEFALLYRWHGLVPSSLEFEGEKFPSVDALFNNQLLIDKGLGRWIDASSRQAAGEIGPFNTPDYIMEAERASLLLGREANLQSYNEYRKCFSMPPVTSFDQISGDPKVQELLGKLYKNVDSIELYAGLFAEDRIPGGVLGPLIGNMVSVDAFSQALTNPLLSPNVFNETTFTREGMTIIKNTHTMQDVVDRNTTGTHLSAFTREGYKRGS